MTKKVSIVTVVLNRVESIENALKSISSQSYKNIEHVIIDGGSTDGTLEVINDYTFENIKIISENDSGIYDAINKGIIASSGDIIGLLHSDDVYVDSNIIEEVMELFNKNDNLELVYGDLEYVDNNAVKVLRRWKAGEYSRNKLNFGWMPPHPTVFLRKEVIEKVGLYKTDFTISADYDYLIRCFLTVINSINNYVYLQRVIVRMRTGGASNGSFLKLIEKSHQDWRIIKANNIGGIITLLFKNISKIKQFI